MQLGKRLSTLVSRTKPSPTTESHGRGQKENLYHASTLTLDKLPAELVLSITKHLPTASIRALNQTCRRLYGITVPYADSTASVNFNRLDLPAYCPQCEKTAGVRLLQSLEALDAETPITKLFIVLMARSRSDGHEDSPHYIADEEVKYCENGCRKNPDLEHPEIVSERTHQLVRHVQSVRILINMASTSDSRHTSIFKLHPPTASDDNILGGKDSIHRAINSLLTPLKSPFPRSRPKCQLALSGAATGSLLRILTVNLGPCCWNELSASCRRSHDLAQDPVEGCFVRTPDQMHVTPAVAGVCMRAHSEGAVCRGIERDWTLINRRVEGVESPKAEAPARSWLGSMALGGRGSKKETQSSAAWWESQSVFMCPIVQDPLAFVGSTHDRTAWGQLTTIHFEGVTIDTFGLRWLQLITNRKGRIILKNCSTTRADHLWSVMFREAAVEYVRAAYCELENLWDAAHTRDSGEGYSRWDLRSWERWLVEGPSREHCEDWHILALRRGDELE